MPDPPHDPLSALEGRYSPLGSSWATIEQMIPGPQDPPISERVEERAPDRWGPVSQSK
jgi:hypothetical protein